MTYRCHCPANTVKQFILLRISLMTKFISTIHQVISTQKVRNKKYPSLYNGGKHNKWQPLFLNKYA